MASGIGRSVAKRAAEESFHFPLALGWSGAWLQDGLAIHAKLPTGWLGLTPLTQQNNNETTDFNESLP